MPVSHIFRRLQIQNDEAFIHHTNTDLQTGLQPLKIMEMFDLCGVQKLRFFSPANRPGISKYLHLYGVQKLHLGRLMY